MPESIWDPSEVHQRYLQGEDLREISLSLDGKPSVGELEKVVQAERERLKEKPIDQERADMIIALRKEIARLVRLREQYTKTGVDDLVVTQIIAEDGDVLSKQLREGHQTPVTGITAITREIRENRKVLCNLLGLTEVGADLDIALDQALEEIGEDAVVREEKSVLPEVQKREQGADQYLREEAEAGN